MDKAIALILYLLLVVVIWLFFRIGKFKINGENVVGVKWRLLISLFLPLLIVILLFFGLLIFALIAIIVVISFIFYIFSRILKK